MSGRRFVIIALSPALLFVAVADNCESYTDLLNVKHSVRPCLESEFCCGQCSNRYCCSIKAFQLDDDAQEKCPLRREKRESPNMTIAKIIPCVMFSLFFTLCFCMMCPRCWLYKKCRSPMFTGYVTELPPGQAHQRGAEPGYQQVPVPVARVQLIPAAAYQAQPYPPAGPPPSYQEIMMAYPPPQAPYTQAGYSMGQPAYPLQPLAHTSYPPAPPVHMDYTSTQPPYNPAFVDPPGTSH
ncbi:protein shisa-4-like [Brienomyrus brachyistius]|uniref:protein shisa-4-like n=1 Tax=Brienomyrus brachyistius TaxID=42636 RepID=UPI0020B36CA2|nr:protein shisa-4-like [Brienomyrus brachyistius]